MSSLSISFLFLFFFPIHLSLFILCSSFFPFHLSFSSFLFSVLFLFFLLSSLFPFFIHLLSSSPLIPLSLSLFLFYLFLPFSFLSLAFLFDYSFPCLFNFFLSLYPVFLSPSLSLCYSSFSLSVFPPKDPTSIAASNIKHRPGNPY